VFDSITNLEQKLAAAGYIADHALATTVYLAGRLSKPLFLEGEPGVGKTALAKAIAGLLDTELIRLQCYEGLDAPAALYEWNYLRQMLEIRLQEARGVDRTELGRNIFGPEFLLQRPLLRAIRHDAPRPAVLLVDEIDRSDEEFEAFLLEVLSDFQITIPELGTLRATHPPFVVLTSNRTREMHDALKRRCLYHWIDYPSLEKELAIVAAAVPGVGVRLGTQVCVFMEQLRQQDYYKRPGVAETIDWARALLALGIAELDADIVAATLGCILKYRSDQAALSGAVLQQVLARARDASARVPAAGQRVAS
jgi:MoxR-like ATPase